VPYGYSSKQPQLCACPFLSSYRCRFRGDVRLVGTFAQSIGDTTLDNPHDPEVFLIELQNPRLDGRRGRRGVQYYLGLLEEGQARIVEASQAEQGECQRKPVGSERPPTAEKKGQNRREETNS
jgi:hypothetical protein